MEQIYGFSGLEKVRYLNNLRVHHRNLERVADRMIEFLHPHNDVSIISLSGVSGAGKTTLVKELVPALLESDDFGYPGGIFFVEAPATIGRPMEVSALYDNVIWLSREVMDEKKYGVSEMDDRVLMVPRRDARKVDVRRREMLHVLRMRKVLALAIDEAFHFFRMGNLHATLDTIKSLAKDDGPKIILISGFEMIKAVTGYAQVQLRSMDLYLPRYGAISGYPAKAKKKEIESYEQKEMKLYGEILQTMEGKWPWPDAPKFVGNLNHFYDNCLGNMRMTKKRSEAILQLQNRNNGKWDDGFIEDTRLSLVKIARIKEEFEEGEMKVRGFDDGHLAAEV
ncbi:ATP-binding protein [Cupriavidus sp. TMH.W2]|uniref:ATP-binding protein n=1 Tax=Cupriavidus sp. TMH.W2 TaxID=3434465 RepID=UPI003D77EFB5